jgi:hypothetical protein
MPIQKLLLCTANSCFLSARVGNVCTSWSPMSGSSSKISISEIGHLFISFAHPDSNQLWQNGIVGFAAFAPLVILLCGGKKAVIAGVVIILAIVVPVLRTSRCFWSPLNKCGFWSWRMTHVLPSVPAQKHPSVTAQVPPLEIPAQK